MRHANIFMSVIKAIVLSLQTIGLLCSQCELYSCSFDMLQIGNVHACLAVGFYKANTIGLVGHASVQVRQRLLHSNSGDSGQGSLQQEETHVQLI